VTTIDSDVFAQHNKRVNLTVRPVTRLADLNLTRDSTGTRKARARLVPQVTRGVSRVGDRMSRFFGLSVTGVLAILVLACPKRSPSLDAPTLLDATMSITKISPQSGSVVDASTTVNAVVEYSIKNFDGGQFYVSIQFETQTPGRTITAMQGSPTMGTPLDKASGTVAVSQPLPPVLARTVLRRPLKMWIFINRKLGEWAGEQIAQAGPIEYTVK